jgi:hypothetical protein
LSPIAEQKGTKSGQSAPILITRQAKHKANNRELSTIVTENREHNSTMSNHSPQASSEDNHLFASLSSNKHAAIKSGGDESIEQTHDEGTSSSSCTHPSKKLKTGDDEKLAARQLPLAPTLEAYLINEGHTKYSIRPEWCIGNDNDGVPVEHEWYRTSSSLPVPSEDRAEPFDRTPPFGPLHDALGLGQHHDRSTNDASFMMMERQAMRAEEYSGEEEINNEEIDVEESVEEDRLRFHQRRRRKRAAGPSVLPDQEEEGQEEEGAAVAAGDPNHSTTELKVSYLLVCLIAFVYHHMAQHKAPHMYRLLFMDLITTRPYTWQSSRIPKRPLWH